MIEAIASALIRRRRDPGRGQRGLTLVELMISLVVSSVLIGFVLSVHVRFSAAFHGQTKLSDVQQTLQSARDAILPELRQAGFGMPNGFRTAAWGTPTVVVPSLQVENNADGSGPDLVRFFYADPSAQARVLTFDGTDLQWVAVDDEDEFEIGDVVVMVNPRFVTVTGGADLTEYAACVVEITNLTAGAPATMVFDSSSGYNSASNGHCTEVLNGDADVMVYRFVGKSFRIDPNRKGLSVLQLSPSGEMVSSDWVDLGIGFTDLQIASRFHETADPSDRDGDGDPTRDWYSGEAQEEPDLTGTRAIGGTLTNLSVSIVLRTSGESTLVPTAATPDLTDPTYPQNNRLGDAPSIQLQGIPDASRPEPLRGHHNYRYSSSMVDMRNLGVGQ